MREAFNDVYAIFFWGRGRFFKKKHKYTVCK